MGGLGCGRVLPYSATYGDSIDFVYIKVSLDSIDYLHAHYKNRRLVDITCIAVAN